MTRIKKYNLPLLKAAKFQIRVSHFTFGHSLELLKVKSEICGFSKG